VARRRKTTYPPPKTATRGPRDPDDPRNTGGGRSVTIDLTAMAGRTEIRTGQVVRIATGLYAGERAVVESLVGGVIPAVLVRTEAGRTRRVRAVDLVLDRGGPAEPDAPSD
jgi:hypothetical protein